MRRVKWYLVIFLAKSLFCLIFLFGFCGGAWGQSGSLVESVSGDGRSLEKIYALLEQQYGDLQEGLQMGEEQAVINDEQQCELLNDAKEYYASLLEHPLRINGATASDLERLVVLSDFMIEALLSYRREHGAILSAAELSLVVGFNVEIVNLLEGFLSFSNDGFGSLPSSALFRGDLLYKSNFVFERLKEYSFVPFYSEVRYKCSWGNRYEVGFLAQNDAGEPLFSPIYLPMADFVSLHLAVKDISLGKGWSGNFVIGDYTARVGQGLTIYKGFSMLGGSVSSLCKRGDVIRGYSSGDENNYLRGAAISFGREDLLRYGVNWRFSAFFSNKGVDANVVDGRYTSIVTDGVHNSVASLTKRHSMRQRLLGAYGECEGGSFRVGVNALCYSYSLENGRRVYAYNRYQQFNGWWGNFSLNYYMLLWGGRLFGECAVDCGGGSAFLAGYLYGRGAVEVGLLGRWYGVDYIAPEAGAYCSSSGCCNERGATLFVAHNRWGSKFEGGVDFAYHPWVRYNINCSSLSSKLFVKWSGLADRWSCYVRGSYGYASGISKLALKGSGSYIFSGRFSGKFRGEVAKVVGVGGLSANGCGEIVYSGGGAGGVSSVGSSSGARGAAGGRSGGASGGFVGRLKVSCCLGAFYAPEWSNRLYVYMSDLPLSFNSQLLYGQGFYGYLLANYEIVRGCKVYIKGESVVKWESVSENSESENKEREDEPLRRTLSSLSKLKFGVQIKF